MADPDQAPKIRVTAKQDKRRRCGCAFTKQPTDLALEELGKGEDGFRAFASLLTDPQLKIVLIDPDGEEELVSPEQVEHAKAVLVALDDGSIDDDDVFAQLFEVHFEPEPNSSDPGKSKGEGSGAAASEPETKEKASEGQANETVADAADLAGAEGESASLSEETREQADAAATDQKAAAEEEKQPEETAQPPVAEPSSAKKAPAKKTPAKKPAAKKAVAKKSPANGEGSGGAGGD